MRFTVSQLIEGARAEGHEVILSTEANGHEAGSWEAIDLGPIIAGEAEEPPTILRRTDGQGLLYPGKVHAVAGEAETGKSWLALAAAAEEMGQGHRVLYVDFEDSERTAVARLRALGVPDEHTLERFRYIRAEEPPPPDVGAVVPQGTSLAVFDGVTEAMHLMGLSLKDNDDVAAFLGTLARPVASMGAAVLLIDHVARERARGGIGAQHKLAGVAVSYRLDAVTPFGRGLDGHSRLTVDKDRPGFIRAASAGRKRAADFRLRSEGEDVVVALEPVAFAQADPLRLSPAERRVLDALPTLPPGATITEIGDRVVEMGWDRGLARETISRALHRRLGPLGEADSTEGRWWRIGTADHA